MRVSRNKFGVWLEWLTMVAVVLVAAVSTYWDFSPLFPRGRGLSTFAKLRQGADVLGREADPSKREDQPNFGGCRSIDARMPPNARVFALGVLGPENFGQLGYYYSMAYYLYPRKVAISLGQPPVFRLDGVTGRQADSAEELRQAGYDFIALIDSEHGVRILPLGSMPLKPAETKLKPIPKCDGILALLLPLAVAITGSRMVRWLFKDLYGVLSTGELLASGLAVGAFFLTQLTLALRMAGVHWERVLVVGLVVWTVGEGLLLLFCWRESKFQFRISHFWFLLLVPAASIMWCKFRLAGLLGLEEFDAMAIWAFKAKILHYCAGKEMWAWFRNPALAYAHMDYPLLVPLLHALTYGALGHVNEFVTKFWNQWMLVLLAWAVLGAARFPEKRPLVAAAVVTAILLLPMTEIYAFTEGATIPTLFYTVLSSMQLAIGMVEQQAGRLRLGSLMMMALAMVKFDGMIILALWGLVLFPGRSSRTALWPPRRIGLAGLFGLIAWFPYVVFRLYGPVLSAETSWVKELMMSPGEVLGILPMTWVAMVSRRFLNNDFAMWGSPDNQHAVWQGHWLGWQSLVDHATRGVGWICLLMLAVAWYRGGRMRGVVFRLFLVFLAFAAAISVIQGAVLPAPKTYDLALAVSHLNAGGRYLYPVLMAWFMAGIILLLRTMPGESIDSNEQEHPGQLTSLAPSK
jgi:hypothetical protein